MFAQICPVGTFRTTVASVASGLRHTFGRAIRRTVAVGHGRIKQIFDQSDSTSTRAGAVPVIRCVPSILLTSQRFPGGASVISRAAGTIVLFSLLLPLGGCAHSICVPKIKFQVESLSMPLLPGDPVFVGPGGSGPIWSPPEVISPGGGCCDPCGSCCNPTVPLEPFDPFGWLRVGSQGTQEIDPVGWVFGI